MEVLGSCGSDLGCDLLTCHALIEEASRQERYRCMAKKKTGKTIPKRKRARSRSTQTQQPFEQDSKRRIGQFGGTGEPPLKK